MLAIKVKFQPDLKFCRELFYSNWIIFLPTKRVCAKSFEVLINQNSIFWWHFGKFNRLKKKLEWRI